MIKDTMNKIEKKIRASNAITENNKAEYLELFEALKQELETLAEERKEQAESITGFAGVSLHEAGREKPDPKLLEISVQGLSASVDEFEVSHPNLVAAVNAICSMLSNLGI